jgi:uncharacterized protein
MIEYKTDENTFSEMPILTPKSYQKSKWLFNGHLETIVPSLIRKPALLSLERERINTPDGDFLDLFRIKNNADSLVIINHGLEGNGNRPYVLGMAKIFTGHFDILTWNYRSCGEEMNHQPFFYHSGATYDLDTVIQHVEKDYKSIYLIGFSLGGNLSLKYLGEAKRSEKIKKAVAISVPLHLESSSQKLSAGTNLIYSKRFLKTLKTKIINKSKIFPDEYNLSALKYTKTLFDFDDYFTAPIHGFEDAKDYYAQNSSLHFLEKIDIPVLILNALNDPFLSKRCFPYEIGKVLDHVYMEFPPYGGHVGFQTQEGEYWAEKRAFEFITKDI